MKATRPPDMIVITIEHLPTRSLHCYGNPVIRTPALDHLAENGLRFQNCTVASPLCVPSRVAFFTSRYPSVTGIRDNTLLMPGHEKRHLPAILASSGYACGLFGKNHCFPDPRQAGFVEVHDEHEVRKVHAKRLGGVWPDPPRTIDEATLARQTRRFRWGEHPRPIWYGGLYPFPAAEGPARSNVDSALRFLEAHRDQPAFAWVSFSDPHPPYRCPQPYFAQYRPEELALPPRVAGELETKTFAQQVYYHGAWHHLMDEAQLRQAMGLYYGMLTYVDDCLGALFDGLKRTGRWENTVIVATGDHGEYMGEHGLVRKSAAFYDCLVQVPLIIRGLPGIPPGGEPPVQLEQIDIFPTLLEVAGVAAPAGIQGRSLMPALRGEACGRECTYAEVGSSEPLPAGGPRAELAALKAGANREEDLSELPLVESGSFYLSRGRMIRSGRWKYAHYSDDRPELYDLSADPWELRNLAGSAGYKTEEEALRRQLLERTIEAGDPR